MYWQYFPTSYLMSIAKLLVNTNTTFCLSYKLTKIIFKFCYLSSVNVVCRTYTILSFINTSVLVGLLYTHILIKF